MRKKRNKYKTEMSEQEKIIVTTKQFLNRLPNKKYFKKFTNKEEGIPEANMKDEDTQTVDESEAEQSEKQRKTKKRKGGQGP